MPLTTEQLNEVVARTGAKSDLSNLQFNVQTQTGEIIPATINPSQAATIVLGGGVQSRGTSSPMPTPMTFTPEETQNELAKARQLQIETNKTLAALGLPQVPIPELPKPGVSLPNASAPGGSPTPIQVRPQGNVPGTNIPQPTPYATGTPPPNTSPAISLTTNTEIEKYRKLIEDESAQIKAGLATGGKTQILTDLFQKFGVAKETTLLNDYNSLILEKTQALRKLPEDIRLTLQDVGVSENQLNRLVQKESQKPLEVLRDLMEQKGAAQDRINQSLKFVGLFADAAMADQAAKIEALKFDLETKKDIYKGLRDDQTNILKLALDEKGEILKIADTAIKNGATQLVVNQILSSTSSVEAQSKFAGSGFGVKPDTSPSVIGSAETGYYQYDQITNSWKPIIGAGGSSTQNSNFTDVMQTSIDLGSTPEQAAREAAIAAEGIGIQVSDKLLTQWKNLAKTLKKTPTTSVSKTETPIEYGKGAFSNVSFEDRVKQLKQIFGNDETLINPELKKDGYFSQIGFGSLIKKVSDIGTGTSAFFTNLFGQ